MGLPGISIRRSKLSRRKKNKAFRATDNLLREHANLADSQRVVSIGDNEVVRRFVWPARQAGGPALRCNAASGSLWFH